MREALRELSSWWHAGHTVAMATVISTWNSAPRQPGATMLVGPDRSVVGSVSGGCVESSVYELGIEVLDGARARSVSYGVSDDDAFSVGLTCGGTMDVYVEAINKESFPDLGEVVTDIEHGNPVAVATIVSGDNVGRRIVVRTDGHAGTLGSDALTATVIADARMLLGQGVSRLHQDRANDQQPGTDVDVFIASYAPPPRMIVFGAIDFAAAVCRIGKFLGYRVTVCDARATFATVKRFPDADEVVVDWPHRYLMQTSTDDRTVLCVLTHDPKFDVPLLELALDLPVAYIGAMGSRRTHVDRVNRLSGLGINPAKIARLASPIGLDIGSRTPEETAVSIAAEFISVRYGGTGQPLRLLDGPVHRTHKPGHIPSV